MPSVIKRVALAKLGYSGMQHLFRITIASTRPQKEEMPKILKIILLLALFPTICCMALAMGVEVWLEVFEVLEEEI